MKHQTDRCTSRARKFSLINRSSEKINIQIKFPTILAWFYFLLNKALPNIINFCKYFFHHNLLYHSRHEIPEWMESLLYKNLILNDFNMYEAHKKDDKIDFVISATTERQRSQVHQMIVDFLNIKCRFAWRDVIGCPRDVTTWST